MMEKIVSVIKRDYITNVEDLKKICEEEGCNFLQIVGKECQYCKNKTELVDSEINYGKSYGMIYLCKSCNAYVGTYSKTIRALGSVANEKLRVIRKQTHKSFDRLWNNVVGKNYFNSRQEAYNWLAVKMEKNVRLTHIAMFGENECKQVIDISSNFIKDCDC